MKGGIGGTEITDYVITDDYIENKGQVNEDGTTKKIMKMYDFSYTPLTDDVDKYNSLISLPEEEEKEEEKEEEDKNEIDIQNNYDDDIKIQTSSPVYGSVSNKGRSDFNPTLITNSSSPNIDKLDESEVQAIKDNLMREMLGPKTIKEIGEIVDEWINLKIEKSIEANIGNNDGLQNSLSASKELINTVHGSEQ